MQNLVDKIFQLQSKMGYIKKINQSVEERMDYYRDITLSLVKEAMEALDETPWRPWINIFEQQLDRNKAAFEVCDVIVFAIVLFIILEPSISLEEAMDKTLAKIENRINNEGYGRKERKQ
jgi:hypothetical protein